MGSSIQGHTDDVFMGFWIQSIQPVVFTSTLFFAFSLILPEGAAQSLSQADKGTHLAADLSSDSDHLSPPRPAGNKYVCCLILGEKKEISAA